MKMVMMGGNSMKVMRGENGMAPADCPAGSYYEGPKETVVACGEGGMSYSVAKPGSGMMMKSGKAYPEGAMMMTPSGGDVSPGGGTSTGATTN